MTTKSSMITHFSFISMLMYCLASPQTLSQFILYGRYYQDTTCGCWQSAKVNTSVSLNNIKAHEPN